jgi:hypothetical protein
MFGRYPKCAQRVARDAVDELKRVLSAKEMDDMAQASSTFRQTNQETLTRQPSIGSDQVQRMTVYDPRGQKIGLWRLGVPMSPGHKEHC